jgi:glutathione S-transferase
MRPRRSKPDRCQFASITGQARPTRVWLALEHKGIPYHRKTLSFDAGDLRTAEFGALNPRRRVPVLVDDDFALTESAAIVEYIEERWPSGPALVAIRASARSSGAWCAKPMTIWPTSASVWRGARARRACQTICGESLPMGGRRDRRISDR